MGGRELAKRPFEKIQIDFTKLPKVGRYRYLLVLVDHLTYFVEAFPVVRATAKTVIKIILEEIILRYGTIAIIDSDRGPRFTSKIIIKRQLNCLVPNGNIILPGTHRVLGKEKG